MTEVGYTELDSEGNPVSGLVVAARLRASTGWLADRTGEVVRAAETTSEDDGTWQLDLTPTGAFQDSGAYYALIVGTSQYRISVPSTGGPYRYPDLVLGEIGDTPAVPGLVSHDADNQLVLHSDGLYVPPGEGGGGSGTPGTPGQPRFYGHGQPGVIPSAQPDDLYLDTDSGIIYRAI